MPEAHLAGNSVAVTASLPAFLRWFPLIYLQGATAPFSLKTLHWRVFRALEPSKPAENRLEMQPNLLETASPGI